MGIFLCMTETRWDNEQLALAPRLTRDWFTTLRAAIVAFDHEVDAAEIRRLERYCLELAAVKDAKPCASEVRLASELATSKSEQGSSEASSGYYSEHVLGYAPDGQPTPGMLRPELRSNDPRTDPCRSSPDNCSCSRGTAGCDLVHWSDAPRSNEALPGRWRTGRKLGRTLYFDDVCVGMVDRPEMAEAIVCAMNAHRPANPRLPVGATLCGVHGLCCEVHGQREARGCSCVCHDCAEPGRGITDEERARRHYLGGTHEGHCRALVALMREVREDERRCSETPRLPTEKQIKAWLESVSVKGPARVATGSLTILDAIDWTPDEKGEADG